MYYIARDKDGRLYLYTSNPKKDQFSGEWELRDNKGRSFLIMIDFFLKSNGKIKNQRRLNLKLNNEYVNVQYHYL